MACTVWVKWLFWVLNVSKTVWQCCLAGSVVLYGRQCGDIWQGCLAGDFQFIASFPFGFWPIRQTVMPS